MKTLTAGLTMPAATALAGTGAHAQPPQEACARLANLFVPAWAIGLPTSGAAETRLRDATGTGLIARRAGLGGPALRTPPVPHAPPRQ
jgi:hypothetical protein